MNAAYWASLPSSACTAQTAGSSGPDRITAYGYDDAGRVNAVTAGSGTSAEATERTDYRENGTTNSVTDAKGNVTRYGYDGFDRVATITYPDGTTDQAQYDADGHLQGRTLRDGQTIGFSYDGPGRMTEKRPAGENATRYGYDLLGNLTSTWRADLGTNTLSYDALGRLTGEQQPFGSMAYGYDTAGRRTRVTWGDGFFVTYDYDKLGAMTAIRESGVTVLAELRYDDLGRRTRLGRSNGTETRYSYDAGSRLTGLVHDLAGGDADASLGFGYTNAGQIASRTQSNPAYAFTDSYTIDRAYSVNALNQYSAAGSVTLGYDKRGNLTGSGTQSYAYTLENRLRSASGGISLYYDALGRLMEYDTDTATRFVHQGDHIAAELANPNGGIQRRYVYGPGADEPLLWYEGSGTSDRRWLVADERGSIVAVTDSGGKALAINRYDAYGIPGAGNLGRFQYTGQAWLPTLGLYHYKARTYSPTLGRFLQTDPIGYGDGMNWYAYAGNDPINKVDPTGLEGCSGEDFIKNNTLEAAPCVVEGGGSVKNPPDDGVGFGPALEKALAYGDGARGGRPPYDPVAMVKIPILAAQNRVNDARMEFLIRDRLSWLRFLGFDVSIR